MPIDPATSSIAARLDEPAADRRGIDQATAAPPGVRSESAQAVDLRARLRGALDLMTEGLVERDDAARIVLLAAVVGEHALLVGPPGTAKSEIARRLRDALDEGAYFERLLTKFSVPEEIFGPLSIKGLERDEYVRLCEGYLPTARVAFLDEIFNANSAILNALLTVLNEREFDNGTRRVATPLMAVVAATNQIPDAPELAALDDRFLLRCHVTPVSAEGFGALLAAAPPALDGPARPGARPRAVRLGAAELEALRARASTVELAPSLLSLCAAMREDLAAEGIYVSDRRWRKIAGALRVVAASEGRARASIVDAWLLAHSLWRKPEQIELVTRKLRERIDAVLVDEPRRFARMADAFEAELGREESAQQSVCDDEGRPLYVDAAGRHTTEPYEVHQAVDGSGNLLFVAPQGMPARGRRGFTLPELWAGYFEEKHDGMRRFDAWADNPLNHLEIKELRRLVEEPARYLHEHVDGRVAQLDELVADARALAASVDGVLDDAGSVFAGRATARATSERLAAARGALDEITPRLERLRARAARLPRRDG